MSIEARHALEDKLARPNTPHGDTDEEFLTHRTAITAYGASTFRVDDIILTHSIACLPNFTLLWKPDSIERITPDSFKLLELAEPKADLVIIGTGDTWQRLPADVTNYLDSIHIRYEAMNSIHAAGTFSLLNDEGRRVAAFILLVTEQSDAVKEMNRKPLTKQDRIRNKYLDKYLVRDSKLG